MKEKFFESLYKSFDKLPFNNKSIGYFIRKIHTMFLFRIFIMIFITTNVNSLYIILYIVSSFIGLHLLFKECILTKLEQKLTSDNRSALDYVLNKLSIKINSNSQSICELCVLIIILGFVVFKINRVKK